MISTLIPTTELLAILEKNRVEHVQLFQTAYANYRTAVQIALQERLAVVKSGVDFDLVFSVGFPPISHVDDYDLAIKMLGLHANADIELNLDAAKCLIMNDWGWSITFDESVSHYSGATAGVRNSTGGPVATTPRI